MGLGMAQPHTPAPHHVADRTYAVALQISRLAADRVHPVGEKHWPITGLQKRATIVVTFHHLTER